MSTVTTVETLVRGRGTSLRLGIRLRLLDPILSLAFALALALPLLAIPLDHHHMSCSFLDAILGSFQHPMQLG